MSSQNPECPCCSGGPFRQLIDLGDQPLSGLYLDKPVSDIPSARLALEYCSACSFVRKAKYVSARNYEEIDRPTSGQLPFYTDRIITEILEGQSPDEPLLEIGANDGTFLTELAGRGFSNLMGVEPSPKLAATAEARGHEIFCGYFHAESAGVVERSFGKPKTIICRHTLEHVPEPRSFLEAARSILAPGGRIYVELPDTMWILDRLQIHEIWDEHENYFTPGTLGKSLVQAGFTGVQCRTQRHRDARNICCWAGNSGAPTEEVPAEAELELCHAFRDRFEALGKAVRESVQTVSHPVYLIGAGHNQANYAQFMEIGDLVDGLIDDASWKTGRFLSAPTPKPIISTAELCSIDSPCTLIATAFPFPKWMDSIRNLREAKGDIWIKPYPDGFPQPEVG